MVNIKVCEKYLYTLTLFILPLMVIDFYFFFFWIISFIFIFLKLKFYRINLFEDRLELMTGIVVRRKQIVYLNEINNLELKYNFIQDYFKCASVVIITGNDYQIVLDSIANYELLFSKKSD